MDNAAGALRVLDDIGENGFDLGKIRRIGTDAATPDLGIAENGRERLVQFVGEGAGERSEGPGAGEVGQFAPLLRGIRLRLLPRRHVDRESAEEDRLTGGVLFDPTRC